MSMTRAFLPLVAVAGVFLCACSDDSTGPEAGASFQLEPGERAWLQPVDQYVRFLRVQEDSRCPMQAQCVWAGDGEVAIELTPEDGHAAETELHTNADVGPQAVVLERYELRLLRLEPYPESGQIPAGDYRVTLVLQERFD